MTSKKYIILKVASKLFFKQGIQHITMEEIAEKCRISKKTIYKYFENKNDLLLSIIKLEAIQFEKVISKNKQQNLNALEELIHFLNYANNIYQTISPLFIRELKKYYPENFIIALKYKNNIALPFIINNIKKGKQQKLYKEDINAEEIYEPFDKIYRLAFSNDFFNNSDTNKSSINFLSSSFIHRLISSDRLKWFNEYHNKKYNF